MASVSELQVIIRGQDELSGKLSAIQNGLSGLGSKMQETGGHAGVFGTALSGALSVFTGGAILGAVSSGFGALSNFIKGGIADAKDANVIFAQSEAVIKSTGGAAGVSAQQVADYASSLSAASGASLFGDDQIAQSENLLLTFTNIKGKSLEAATAVSVDMAQAMGGAPKDAAIQLGKALNDPIAGISALSRVGVTFDDQQKKNIATMIKHGDVAGAQGVILGELNKEFGGSAAAAAKADGGMARFKDRMGELGESIGHQLEPVTQRFFAFMAGPGSAAIERVAGVLSGGLGTALTWLSGSVLPALSAGWQALQAPLQAVIGFLTPIVTWAVDFVSKASPLLVVIRALASGWGDMLAAWKQTGSVGEVLDSFLNTLSGLGPVGHTIATFIGVAQSFATTALAIGRAIWNGDTAGAVTAFKTGMAGIGDNIRALAANLGAWLSGVATTIATNVLTWGRAFIGWIGPHIPGILAALGTLATSVWGWITAQVPIITEKVLGWGRSFIGWVAPYIPIVLGKLGELATSVWDWITKQAPLILAKLEAWGTSFIDWIGPKVAPLLAKAGELATSLWGWVQEQAPILLAKLQTWGENLVAWIGPKIPGLLAKAGELASRFLAWVGEQAAPLLTKLGEWGQSFIAWVVPTVTKFLETWPAQFNRFLTWIGEQAGPILLKLGEWALKFVEWVAPMIPKLLLGLAGVALALGTFIVETAGVLIVKLVQWGAAMLGWVGKNVLPKLPGVLADIGSAIINWIVGAAKTLAGEAGKIGSSIVGGIERGISGAWGRFLGWLHDQIMKIPKVIRDFLGIGSPSKVLADEVGVPIVQGIAAGMLSANPMLQDVAVNVARGTVSSMRSAVNLGTGGSDFTRIGQQTLDDLTTGVRTQAPGLFGSFQEIVQGSLRAVGDALMVGRPQSPMLRYGRQTLDDLTTGMQSRRQNLFGEALKAGQTLTDGLQAALGGGGGKLGAGTGMGSGFGGAHPWDIGWKAGGDLTQGLLAAAPGALATASQFGAQVGAAISNGIAGNLRFPDFQFGGAGQAHIGTFAQGGLSGGPAAVLPPGGGGTVIHPGAIVINAGSNVSAGDIANQVIAKIDQTSRTRR